MKLITYIQTAFGLSRRKIIDQMKVGQITLNGELIERFTMECKVGDVLEIYQDGTQTNHIIQKLDDQESVIIAFHKPLGCVVSKSDPHNQTIYELLPEEFQSLDYIGRLDKDSTGLLLLTSDKALVHQFAHPSGGMIKRYIVRVDTLLSNDECDIIRKGIRVDENGNMIGVKSSQPPFIKDEQGFLKVESIAQEEKKGYVELTLELVEGHKRHIRRLLKAIGKKVYAIHRISFGEYDLGSLKVGKWKICSLTA